MTKAQDFVAKTTSRGEELKALAVAKKAVAETSHIKLIDNIIADLNKEQVVDESKQECCKAQAETDQVAWW